MLTNKLKRLLEKFINHASFVYKNMRKKAFKNYIYSYQTLCDSWLEHIYQKKIKFSTGGAKQLGHDFNYLRFNLYLLKIPSFYFVL